MIENFPALFLVLGAVCSRSSPRRGAPFSFLLWPAMALGAILSTPLGTEITGET